VLLRLVLAELRHRPGRAAFLLAGYSLGVSVMVVLLAVGEAMLEQARDRALVGGGDLVLIPAGVSPELLKAGGSTSLFLGIDQARFLQRQVLESRRAREELGVEGSSPVLDAKLLELFAPAGEARAIATGEIPSRARAAGAAPTLLAGAWEDGDADRRWADPSPQELYTEIDRLHLPPPAAAGDSTWAEWHYFNAVLDADRWLYVTLMVGGRVGVPGEWGGRVLLTLREPDGTHRSLTRDYPDAEVRFDTLSPDLRFGVDDFVLLAGGVYRVRAGAGDHRVELEVTPAPGRYFPPAELGGAELVSGYVAPALHASASGRICSTGPSAFLRARSAACERIEAVASYHDHNWGVWRDVSWEWGAASGERLSLLYGVVRGQDTPEQGLFAYLVDERGARGLFRPRAIRFPEQQTAVLDGRALRVPRRIEFDDPRRGLRVSIEVTAVHLTDTGRERDRFFVQMRGLATVTQPGYPDESLPGFFETYVDGES
jgi:hypothetical protein